MAALVVVDSGVALATVFEEHLSQKASALFVSWAQENTQLHAPMLFRYEVVAVVRRALYQGRIAHQDAITARDQLLTLPVQYHVDQPLLERAFEIATEHNRPTAYDSQYLALAERLQCDFWTADEKLFNAIGAKRPAVKWLAQFELDQTKGE